MRTFISVFALLAFSFFSVASVQAGPLDGLWRNKEERITLQIESTTNGIRSKRTDQDAWVTYTKDSSTRYTDRQGNTYEVVGENEIVWREHRSGKRITLMRMYEKPGGWTDDATNRDSGSSDDQDRNRDAGDDYRRNGKFEHRDTDREGDNRTDNRHEYGNYGRFSSLGGQWFNQKSRQIINIQAANNGLRVYKGDRGRAMLFAPSRDSKVFRNKQGGTLTWLNDNTIQMKTSGNQNLIFHRADGKQVTKGSKEKSKGNGRGHVHDQAKKSK